MHLKWEFREGSPPQKKLKLFPKKVGYEPQSFYKFIFLLNENLQKKMLIVKRGSKMSFFNTMMGYFKLLELKGTPPQHIFILKSDHIGHINS